MDYKLKNRHTLKSKDSKKIFIDLNSKFENQIFNPKSSFEIAELGDKKIVLVDNEPSLIYYGKQLFFTLLGLNKYSPQNFFVTVDMGAVKFVTNGADVMAPGIVDADENIQENDVVWICDETHKKPLAVGMALMPGEQMKNKKEGKSVKIFHHVGDELWNSLSKQN